MTQIPLALSDRRRTVPKETSLIMRNRFIEKNPALNNDMPSYIARPGLRYWQTLGDGPIRCIFSQPGAFDDDLFVVSYNTLFRVSRVDGSARILFTELAGGDERTTVRMAATGDIGTITPHLWIADSEALYVYTEDGYSGGTFAASALPADGDTVTLGSIVYRMSSGSLDTGTPDGSIANPWRVLIGGTVPVTITNLFNAINGAGTAGTDYSTALTANSDIHALTLTSLGFNLQAVANGTTGDSLETTTTSASFTLGDATLTGGGTEGVTPVSLPDGAGAIDVAVINSFVIVIPAQGAGINGRFYWVQPGEVVIDPLDFATAERSADPIYGVVVFNDQFWLPGQNTTEIWYVSGDPDAPMQRLQGTVFDRGTIPGTAIQIKDFMVMIDNDGGVFQVQGQERRISTSDISEKLRHAVNQQNITG